MPNDPVEVLFTLLYLLRKRLDRIQTMIGSDPARAKEKLAEVSVEPGDLIGPGEP